jgi:hypothetical protein
MIMLPLALIWNLLLPSPALADELVLHLIPAPTRTDWRSPRKLAISALRNELVAHEGLKRHGIGHLYVELKCGNTRILTGTTSTGNKEERQALFKEGYGLGVLFKNYQGKLDAPAEVEEDLRSTLASGRSSFIRFLISRDACQRALLYWMEYQFRGYDRIYAGLNARPLKGESAGCTAFGASFLEILGLQDPLFEEQWKTRLVVPRKFVGGPLTAKRVRIWKLLFAFSAGWDADLSRGGFALDFWDPEKMNDWIRNISESLASGGPQPLPWPASSTRLEASPGVEVDARTAPVPTGQVFDSLQVP